MGEHQQYKPSPDEFLLTGLFGAAIYIFLATIILYALLKQPKNKFSKYFFIFMLIVCFFEIPRFLSIAITTNYQSKLFYIFHLISSIFFFAGFTIVCLQWSSLLKLGNYVSIVYSFKGVLISNAIFTIIDIIAMIVCGTSSSLHSFFRSIFFEWFTFLDTFKNLLYSSLLFFYGIKLIIKFYRYNTIELTYNIFQSDLITEQNTPYGQRKTAFGIALKKLTIVLFLTTLCFFIRVMMLIFKIIALRGNMMMSSPTVPLFGFIWFTLSDWIPRCIPSFAFVYLMNMKRSNLKRGGNADNLIQGAYMKQSHPGGSSNTYPFIFSYEDDDDDLSSLNDPQGEYFDDEEYLSEQYSDDINPMPMKPYEWSEVSEENASVDDDEEVVLLNGKGRINSGKSPGKSSKLSFLSRNHYSWTALSSGFSLSNFTTTSSAPSTPKKPQDLESNIPNGEGDDISMTSFTSLSQLTSNRNNRTFQGSGRTSPLQKNDGYNNTSIEPIRMQKRSVEL